MGRAGGERGKRSSWRPKNEDHMRSNTGHNIDGERYQESQKTQDVPSNTVAAGNSGFTNSNQQQYHHRSISSRWHRKSTNNNGYLSSNRNQQPSNHFRNPRIVRHDRTIEAPRKPDKDEGPHSLLPSPASHSFIDETSHLMDGRQIGNKTENHLFVTPPMLSGYRMPTPPPLAQDEMSRTMHIEPEWEWVSRYARMSRCDLVNGVVCDPPDIAVVVGVIVKDPEQLAKLEREEHDACDPEANIRKSINDVYTE